MPGTGLPSTAVSEESPIGRRIVLGMLGFGAVGIVAGERIQGGLERFLRPVTQNDPTGLSSFVPTAGRFRIYTVVYPMPERSDDEYRLTVDEPEDVRLMQEIFSRLAASGRRVTTREAIALLDREPALARINAHLRHKAANLRSVALDAGIA